MAFPAVPGESKSQINKAGDFFTQSGIDITDTAWALDLANRWRACHAQLINTFQATLRVKLKEFDGNPVAAQRLKRMPTIIDKLKRFPAMNLTTMQDIAGVRAVMRSVADVYKLAAGYRNNSNFLHELANEYDYIRNPRDEDGYRSLHLVYKYKNPRNPAYDGLRIEMQLRTRLQHLWATAVETMGTFLGQALKSRQGDQEWLDYFALISAAFALKERTPPVPKHRHLNRTDLIDLILKADERLGAIDKMSGFSTAVNVIAKSKGKGTSYHLIVLRSLEGSVDIFGFDRDSFADALAEYSRFEKEAADGHKIEPVLVSAGPLRDLRRAYPNFFLDMNDFLEVIRGTLKLRKHSSAAAT